jgi:hypothetical protein
MCVESERDAWLMHANVKFTIFYVICPIEISHSFLFWQETEVEGLCSSCSIFNVPVLSLNQSPPPSQFNSDLLPFKLFFL